MPKTLLITSDQEIYCGSDAGTNLNGNSIDEARFVSQSGIAEIDQNIDREIKVLNTFFSLTNARPEFSFYLDSEIGISARAYKNWKGTGKTQILLGTALIQEEINANLEKEKWVTAVIGILAHEWAHAFQYRAGLDAGIFLKETHADYLAGWYLGSKLATGLPEIDPDVFARFLYLKGSNARYFDSNNYGSPELRVNAMSAGFSMGLQTMRAKGVADPILAANIGYKVVAEIAEKLNGKSK